MHAVLGSSMGGAIVQPMAPAGVELIVGINHEPTFGPLVLFGMGGFDAELQRDTALAIPPLTDADALRDLVGRIGLLAEEVVEIAELDCNPVIVSPSGALVVDAKLRLV